MARVRVLLGQERLYVFAGVLGGVLTLVALAAGASPVVAPIIGFPLSGLVAYLLHLLLVRAEDTPRHATKR
jgi:hypothetical protein